MEENFIHIWFDGFSAGLGKLDGQARAALLSSCAARCADSYPVKLYERLRVQSNGELGAFFDLLGAAEDIQTKPLEPGRRWQILYPTCGCNLVTDGYVRAPALCECSQLSLQYCLARVFPEYSFAVAKEKTVLQGDNCCCFLITLEGRSPHA